jgi:hypothetical protein
MKTENNQNQVHEMRYFRDLAMSYFPEDMPEVAVRKLRKEIAGYPELFNALSEANYKSRKQIVTPLQKELIIKYLGEP